jgi:hypothetical protein
MSEEQPQFKVTDRRPFNPDGTPREIPEDEAATKQERAGASASAGAETVVTANAAAAPPAAESAPEPQASDAGTDPSYAEFPQPEEEVPGENDPASFVNFLMSIASNAAASLGMMEHPVTGERGVDLPLGKHWIDVLGMIQEKTKGNLSPQEHRILEGLLADLRMQFVSLSNTAPSPKQRFSGRDILGGK